MRIGVEAKWERGYGYKILLAGEGGFGYGNIGRTAGIYATELTIGRSKGDD